MVKKITGNEFEDAVKTGVSVVDFSAGWCGPCQMLAPVLEEISDEITGINFYNVDVDTETQLSVRFGISNIPALLVMKDGVKQEILVGFKPKEVLTEAFKKYVD